MELIRDYLEYNSSCKFLFIYLERIDEGEEAKGIGSVEERVESKIK